MSKIDDLIEQISEEEYYDERDRSAVDLSDIKRWVRYALQAVKEDLENQPKKEVENR